ncbi:hypothetical protein Bca4012_041705 [Brassica carinata]
MAWFPCIVYVPLALLFLKISSSAFGCGGCLWLTSFYLQLSVACDLWLLATMVFLSQ